MYNRIKELRNALRLSQKAFGARLGVTDAAISSIESGRRNLTEQMEISICREFNVNREWLRTGEGEMFLQLSRDEEIAAYLGQIMSDDDDSFRRRLISVLTRLDEEGLELVVRMAERLAAETKMPAPKGRPDSETLDFEVEGKLIP